MGWQSDRSRFRRRRADLMKFLGRRCYLCGKWMRRPSDDHVVPKRLGGRRGRNILLAHSACNAAKADRAPYPCELLLTAAVYDRIEAFRAANP